MGVKFENVTKMYQSGRPAVQDLSLEVQSGELLVLIGPSGCGKTTTLRMINRLEEQTSGTISIDGRDIRSYDPVQLRRGIGYTIQPYGAVSIHRPNLGSTATWHRLYHSADGAFAAYDH